VVGLLVFAAGLLATFAGLDRLGTPELRALDLREQLIMAGLLLGGVVVASLGVCEAAGLTPLPDAPTSALLWLAGMLGVVDVCRIYIDSLRMLGAPPGPLAAVPSSSNWALFIGAIVSGGAAMLLGPARRGVFPGDKQDPARFRTTGELEKTPVDREKTYHADRWWMRDRAGSVLVWDDQAQAWSPWVEGRGPELPPGWSPLDPSP
jgi:hypothetical protein